MAMFPILGNISNTVAQSLNALDEGTAALTDLTRIARTSAYVSRVESEIEGAAALADLLKTTKVTDAALRAFRESRDAA